MLALFLFLSSLIVVVCLLAGPNDNVRCYYCDGGLKNWQPTDEPWTEHRHWFPRCPHLQVTLCMPQCDLILPLLV